MTDLVKVALIAATPPLAVGICNLIVNLYTNRRMTVVKKSVDGVKDQLVAATAKSSFAAGVKHEQDSPEIKPTI